MPDSIKNPYIGPRPFEEEDSPNFFGRKDERDKLTSLLVSHRVVLFYAPSGAGKTSLIKAAVIPEMRESADVEVLPVTRVGGDLPPGIDPGRVKNVYVFNTLVNLAGREAQPGDFVGRSLHEGLRPYLEHREEAQRLPPQLLVLDQFEELFTTHLDRYGERAEFFLQLQQCLTAYPQVSLLLSMREDYIANLDFYVIQMPDRLRTRFRIDLLNYESALEAVKEPAKRADRPFAEGVAEELVDNLRRLQSGRRQDEGTRKATPLGNYVEPVHLQIVCQQLWPKIPAERKTILSEDVHAFGDVDQALTQFYKTALENVVHQTDIKERRLREWFDKSLVTPDRTRGLVYRGATETQGLPNSAVHILYQAYIIRTVSRGNDVWYELAHDRLVEPILVDNAAWRQEKLSRLQRQAAVWESENRPKGLLLSGQDLEEAETWAEAHFDELEKGEKDFLEACREAREAEENERKLAAAIEERRRHELETALKLAEETEARRRAEEKALIEAEQRAKERTQAASRMRTLFWIAAVFGVIALGAAIAAGYAWRQASRQMRIATARELAAHSQATVESFLQRSLLLGLEALAITRRADEPRVPIAEEVLRQALGKIGGRGFSGHEGSISAVAISPDNRWLVTGSEDKTARLWDLTSRDPAAAPVVLRGHEGPISEVAISTDNRWLVTGSEDNTVRLWNLRLDELVELACRTVGRNLTKEEWHQYMGDRPYQKTCPDFGP